MMLVEIPDPEIILGVILAFILGVGGLYAYYKIRPMIKNEDFILENQLLGMVVEAQRGKKVIRLTSRLYKVLGLLWMKTMPVSNYLYVFIVSLARSFK